MHINRVDLTLSAYYMARHLEQRSRLASAWHALHVYRANPHGAWFTTPTDEDVLSTIAATNGGAHGQ